MSTIPTITNTGQTEWENRHKTFSDRIEGLYDMWNAHSEDLIGGYNAMTSTIQAFIAQAISDNTTVRALGAGWSFTRVAVTAGRMLNTKPLNWRFHLPESDIAPRYRGSRRHLLFAQCGCSIQELNLHLKRSQQCLPTSGASNGQTIAGALSTGTHGSAFDVGAIPEYVVGLHLIVGPDRHVWLERASYPVITDSFAARLNAECVRDDALFNAALVSFGSFGFIHGVLLETEDLYLLETYRVRHPLDTPLRRLMATLDFDEATGLPFGTKRPFHFQVTVNPYDLKDGAYCSVMYKHPYKPDYTPPPFSKSGHAPGDDAPAFLGGLRNSLPVLVPFLVNWLLKSVYKPYTEPVWGIPSEIFTNTDVRGKVMSTAIAFPLNCVNAVTDLLLELNRTEGPFSGVFAYRYVKSTSATLGFTRFKPITCVLELDGLLCHRDQQFCEKVWEALEAERIPYTVHWGKCCELNPVRLRNMYEADLDAWLAARNQLLDPACRRVFTNGLMEEWGLGSTA